jgi:hypothetical protein
MTVTASVLLSVLLIFPKLLSQLHQTVVLFIMIGLDGDLGNPKTKVIMMVMVKFDPPKVTMVILKYLKVLKRVVLLMVLPSVVVVRMVTLCPLAVVHI